MIWNHLLPQLLETIERQLKSILKRSIWKLPQMFCGNHTQGNEIHDNLGTVSFKIFLLSDLHTAIFWCTQLGLTIWYSLSILVWLLIVDLWKYSSFDQKENSL